MAAEPPLTPGTARRSSARIAPTPSGQRLDSAVEPDRLVKTHCCFCGQQCGIQLKVKDNQVIGFEPWEDFPFNQRHALPQGRQALPARLAPRPAAHAPTAATRRRRRASAPLRLRRGDPARRRGDRAHPVDVRHRRLRRPRRREPDDREVLPAGQVRPRVPEDPIHRLQRPAVHGQRRGAATRRRSASTGPPTRGPTSSQAEVDLDQRRQRRRVRADHHQLRLAGPRERRRRSSSSIRASRRSPAPATCSCRSSPAATSPCSTASCT